MAPIVNDDKLKRHGDPQELRAVSEKVGTVAVGDDDRKSARYVVLRNLERGGGGGGDRPQQRLGNMSPCCATSATLRTRGYKQSCTAAEVTRNAADRDTAQADSR